MATSNINNELKDKARHRIDILQAAFTRADPKSTKKMMDLTEFLLFLRSASIKATRKHVD